MLDSSIKLDFSTWNSYPAVIITAAVQQSPITCIFSCEVEDFDSRFFLEFFIQWERKTESYPPSTTRMPRRPVFPAQRSWRHLLLLTGRKWEIFPTESYGGTPGQSCEGRLSQEPQPNNFFPQEGFWFCVPWILIKSDGSWDDTSLAQESQIVHTVLESPAAEKEPSS